ncbi:hypothetical protein [Acidipila sp. EB88]|uniref:hypothetical protein n=1 Tax=Acidipila sp. EB88 TaxID=2305226 RepID=UPI000F5DE4AC|nr:hypothetical protein [Acidipila sp. EB88]RRA47836.1 hypothetical protein D1Y84_05540 [Acidipila sp. EB88]
MQRFFTLVVLLLFALPVGLSVTGCTTNVSAYCNNAGYGPKTTDIFAVRLPTAQSDTGISLAYGQIGQAGTAVATNCKGSTLSTGAATYGSSDLTHADISPTGSICAGSWNHLSTGGIPDYSICTAPTSSAQVKITASIGGIVSNAVTVYVHPQISAINVTAPTACVPSGTVGPNLAAQTTVFDESGNLIPSQDVSTNVVGNITYTANTPSIVTINNTSVNATAGTALGTNGQVTANQPGGTVITATVAGTGTSSPGTSSAAGYFYTCPPQHQPVAAKQHQHHHQHHRSSDDHCG